MPVRHLIIGSRPGEHGILATVKRFLSDIFRFVHTIRKEQYDIVHVNPSLDPKSLLRDGLFVLLAKMWGLKTLVFFRGWHYENEIQAYWRWLFKAIFSRADAFIVLSRAFQLSLTRWVADRPIYCEFTALDDNDLVGFDIYRALEQRLGASPWKILFMSRLVKEKGLYETIEAFRLLLQQGLSAELIIAGDGPELVPARNHVLLNGPDHVHFTGYLKGEEKKRLLRESHLLCFPTYHGEGMPNVVIESMGFGLPVVSRPLGGLADFFENGVHGFVTESKDPVVVGDLIRKVITDPDKYREMALNNYRFAQMYFKATQSAKRLEHIYNTLLGSLDSRPKASPAKMPPAASA